MEYRHTTPLSYGDWGVSVVGLILLCCTPGLVPHGGCSQRFV